MEEKEVAIQKKRGFYPEYFGGVQKFKSIRRAHKRNLIADDGTIYPKRPFNNRKPTRGRETNELKKLIYDRLKHTS